MTAVQSERAAAEWLIVRVLARLEELNGAFAALDEGFAEQPLATLADELDRIGWTLALLDAREQGDLGVVRHHPAGLRWLLEWRYGALVGVPAVARTTSAAQIWQLAARAFAAETPPVFQKRETGWEIRFGDGTQLDVSRAVLHD